jgi:predicted RND superfamily exporter protein
MKAVNKTKGLARAIVGHPRATLLLALACAAALTPIALRVRLDTNVLDLFPQNHPATAAFARFSRTFVTEQVLIVLAESDDPSTLVRFADEYAARMARSPRVAEVRHRLSAGAGAVLREHLLALLGPEEIDALGAFRSRAAVEAQVRRLRSLLSSPGGSALAPLLTADPLELLSRLGKRMMHGLPVDAQSGYFRSADGKALLLFIRPKASSLDIESSRALITEASATALGLGARLTSGEFHGGPVPEIGFSGACAYAVAYRDWLHDDMSRSTTLSGVAVLVLFAFFFRAIFVLPLVAAPLFLGLLGTTAFSAVFFGRVNAVSLAFGTILLSIGIDIPIQLYNRLREELRGRAPKEALATTLTTLAGPATVATLGPSLVFFACGLSAYRGLSELGILAGVGLLFNLLAMLTVFPALLSLLPPRFWARPAREGSGRVLGVFGRLIALRPSLVLSMALLIFVGSIPFAVRLRFERGLFTHPKNMPAVRVEAELERRFGKRERALIILVEQPRLEEALEQSDAWLPALEQLEREGLLRGFQTLATLLPSRKTQAARQARLEKQHPREIAAELRRALTETSFDLAPFQPFLNQLEHPRRLELRDLTVGDFDFLVRNHLQKDDGTYRLASLVYPAQGQEKGTVAALERVAKRIGGTVTGRPILEQVLGDIAAHDTWVATVVSTATVVLLLAIYYRRRRPFVAVLLPLALAWVGFGGALVLLGIPLNLFNLLSVPLIIGYGIDDHIFLVHQHESDPTHDAGHTISTTGRAIVLTSLSTMAGFLPLATAHFDGLRQLGLAGALAVGLCLIAAFAVLPALLTLLWPNRGNRH